MLYFWLRDCAILFFITLSILQKIHTTHGAKAICSFSANQQLIFERIKDHVVTDSLL